MQIFTFLNQSYALPEIRCLEVLVVSRSESSHRGSWPRPKVGETVVQGAVWWPVLRSVTVTSFLAKVFSCNIYPCCTPLSERGIASGTDVVIHRKCT